MNIHHICIQTNNYKESLDFYTNVLNFELIEETPNFNNRYYNTWLNLNGFMIELQTGKKSQELSDVDNESQGLVHFCLYSADFDNDFNTINSHHQSIFKMKGDNKIYDVGTNRLFKLIAPEGTIIEVRDSETI